MYVSRESPVLLELLVALDIRELVVCLVSVELLVDLEPRERRQAPEAITQRKKLTECFPLRLIQNHSV